jgi:hypothetical protein
MYRHADSSTDLPLIVCGDAMETEPSAPVFVRICAIPKTGIDKIHKIWIYISIFYESQMCIFCLNCHIVQIIQSSFFDTLCISCFDCLISIYTYGIHNSIFAEYFNQLIII